MSNPINSNFNTQSSAVPAAAVTVKKTDEKNLISGEDFRGQSAGKNTSALKGNDQPVRSETEGGA